MKNTVALKDAFGNDVEFKFLDLIKYMDSEYAVLIRADMYENGEIVIVKCVNEDDGGEESFKIVEDDFIYDTVCRIFLKKYQSNDF